MSVEADWITAGAAVGGVIIGNIILWRLHNRQHRFDSLNRVYELMRNTTRERKSVRMFYEHYSKTNGTDQLLHHDECQMVTATIDKIGMLYEFGDLPKYAVMEMYWQSYINYWLMLEPAVQKRRRKTEDYDTSYAKYFERLYWAALDHQRHNYSNPQATTEMQELLEK